LEIFHIFFDINLEINTSVELSAFAKGYSEVTSHNEKDKKHLEELKKARMKEKKFNKSMAHDEFDLIELGHSEKQHFLTDKDIELLENYLMQLILFDDSSLTNLSLRALIRLIKPQSELISTLNDVQLLSDKASVKFLQ